MACRCLARRSAPLNAPPLARYGAPGGAAPNRALLDLAASPAVAFLDDLMPSSPSNLLRQVAYGRLDRAALEAACVYRDYLTTLGLVAGVATPVLVLAGGVPGVISGITAGLALALAPLADAICRQQPPSGAAIQKATSGATAAANAARAGGVDLGDVDPDATALVGAAFVEAASAAGKRLPTSAPTVAGPAGVTITADERAKKERTKRKRIAIAVAKAKAKARIRLLMRQRAQQGKGPPPTTTPGTSGGAARALPWLIGAGIVAKVLL